MRFRIKKAVTDNWTIEAIAKSLKLSIEDLGWSGRHDAKMKGIIIDVTISDQ